VVTVLTEVVRLGMAMHYARRAGFAPAALARYFRPLLAAAAMVAAVLALGDRTLMIMIAVGALAYGIALTVTGAVRIEGTRVPRLRL